MNILKSTTKKAQAFINAYENSNIHSLRECYENFSNSKYIAYKNCIILMRLNNGHDFRILSYNTFQFTCGWKTQDGYRIETRDNSYLIEV